MGIAYKEAREVYYWLRILKDAGIVEIKMVQSFLSDVEVINKILASILKTSKNNNS